MTWTEYGIPFWRQYQNPFAGSATEAYAKRPVAQYQPVTSADVEFNRVRPILERKGVLRPIIDAEFTVVDTKALPPPETEET